MKPLGFGILKRSSYAIIFTLSHAVRDMPAPPGAHFDVGDWLVHALHLCARLRCLVHLRGGA